MTKQELREQAERMVLAEYRKLRKMYPHADQVDVLRQVSEDFAAKYLREKGKR